MYSFKDFTGQILSDKTDMSNQIITGSCFSQETPDTHVFPEDMTGTTFIDCNLDNVFIPQGNTVIRGTQKRFIVQNDLRDWIIDENNNPIKLVQEDFWVDNGYPISTDSIPPDFIRREVLVNCDYLKEKDTEEFKSWFFETPTIIKTEVKLNSIIVSQEKYDEMIINQSYCPFNNVPTISEKNEKGQLVLVGESTYVTIQGKGRFKGGIGFRPFDNKIEDLK